MTFVFLICLGLAWVVVFLPAVMRARLDAPLSSAERFRRRLDLIAPRPSNEGRWIIMPESPDRLSRESFKRGQRRRARILAFLVGACAVTFVIVLLSGGSYWEVQLAFDASLALYVVLLLDAKRRRAERVEKVHDITPQEPPRAREAREQTQAVGEGPLFFDDLDIDDEVEFYEPVSR